MKNIEKIKKMVTNRNIIIIILCSTIILMGICFIFLSMELKKQKDNVDKFNVVFDSVLKQTAVKGSDKEPVGQTNIESAGKVLNMNFSMFAAHDELTYLIKIKNKGTIPAKIVKIHKNPDYDMEIYKQSISPVEITTNDINGRVLAPGEVIDYKITLYYSPSVNKDITKNFSYNLALITESN